MYIMGQILAYHHMIRFKNLRIESYGTIFLKWVSIIVSYDKDCFHDLDTFELKISFPVNDHTLHRKIFYLQLSNGLLAMYEHNQKLLNFLFPMSLIWLILIYVGQKAPLKKEGQKKLMACHRLIQCIKATNTWILSYFYF
jgi:hypothetical protein